MENIDINKFAESFGINSNIFSENLKLKIKSLNFNYEVIEGDEYHNLVLEILKTIDLDRQIIGADERTETWSKGWKENLDEFIQSGYDEKKLKPKFIRDRNIVRFNQQYIRTEDNNFELNFIEIYRHFFIENYFNSVDHIYEFGCGTGFNLLAASSIFSDKALHGSDFVQSSVDLVNEIAKAKNINLNGNLFDMLKPDYSYKIEDNSGIFTFGALEQLASKVDDILEYFITMKPKICIHTEPAMELYDDEVLNDYLAKKFQNKRGYTSGLLGKLKALENEGRIDIIAVKRLNFGSLFMEGYNQIIWKLR